MCAEIEFPSEEEAKVFVIPKWFDVELTDVKEAGNSYLAKHGISDEIKALMK
jgi:CYTH domain-containing protein